MTTEQILLLDGTYNENDKKTIQKVLRKIKPLSRYSDEECIVTGKQIGRAHV